MIFRLSTLTVAVAMGLVAGSTFAQNSLDLVLTQERSDGFASMQNVGAGNEAVVIHQGSDHSTQIDQVASIDSYVSVEQTGVASSPQIQDEGIETSTAVAVDNEANGLWSQVKQNGSNSVANVVQDSGPSTSSTVEQDGIGNVLQSGIALMPNLTHAAGSNGNGATVDQSGRNAKSTMVQAIGAQGDFIDIAQNGISGVGTESTIRQESGTGHTADVTQAGGGLKSAIHQNGHENKTTVFQAGWATGFTNILQDGLKLTDTVSQIGEAAASQVEQKGSLQVAIVDQIAGSGRNIESSILQVTGWGNNATIKQVGEGPLRAMLEQTVLGNGATVTPFGLFTESEILQQGKGNIVSVYQKNDGSVSTIGRMVDMNYVSVAQGGMAASAVQQIGNNGSVIGSQNF